jgi:hypothetical protein
MSVTLKRQKTDTCSAPVELTQKQCLGIIGANHFSCGSDLRTVVMTGPSFLLTRLYNRDRESAQNQCDENGWKCQSHVVENLLKDQNKMGIPNAFAKVA